MNTNDFKTKVFSLSEKIFPMCARLLGNATQAEDAIQEIMLKLWKKRRQFENHPNIEGYVFLTAKNYCLDKLKKNRLKIVQDAPFQNISGTNSQQDAMELQELNEIVKKILKQLPEQQRDVLMLRDIDGYEYSEISELLNLKIEHVRVLAARARKHVGLELEKTYCYERGQY